MSQDRFRVDTLSFKADEKMLSLAKECCEKVNPEIGVFTGRVVSGDQFISDKEKKNGLLIPLQATAQKWKVQLSPRYAILTIFHSLL